MNENRRRNMRDVTTLRTLSDRVVPATRTQTVSRFARLENERARLLRELEAWAARKQDAERKLAALESELAALKNELLGEQAAHVRKPAGKAAGVPSPARQPEVHIEY